MNIIEFIIFKRGWLLLLVQSLIRLVSWNIYIHRLRINILVFLFNPQHKKCVSYHKSAREFSVTKYQREKLIYCHFNCSKIDISTVDIK